MRKLIVLILFVLLATAGFAQVKIHSHNDYVQKQQFSLAFQNKVYQIEADIFEVNGEAIVAHSKKEIDIKQTLNKLYLNKIDSLFKLNKGKVSNDKNYTFTLMIDFKTSWDATFPAFQKHIEKYGEIFNRSKNKKAVQIVISGNRPADSMYHTFPSWVYFDGLPNISYAKADLKRVTMISDNFASYSKWKGIGEIPAEDKAKLKKIIEQAHKLNKAMRFWGAPDTQDCWRQLIDLGADIINTDKIVECKTYFEHK
ncbi:phosphatidylinositol-specific phospholipase C/glycerophosphodiester phosphodiesterase family protein [Pedobacter frigiditerrae]|uniref:phosphatidylinositol-specific phospholipase C/glycerophosphodiester phosphodiesterase family protein n=1 Tax=Pedobacter frigiditerrae TaxID=2530452 RepID=UPI00292E7D51|nr:phosphatidylinositol-specific phospholipase C/glycerophosphodiester phosphodiesterase family protein [Pedobacter frigiditerrae]